jgi:hypothetical protein
MNELSVRQYGTDDLNIHFYSKYGINMEMSIQKKESYLIDINNNKIVKVI